MIVNTYSICKQLKDALKSQILGVTEINPVTQYALDNFGARARVFNQIAVNKDKYARPYIAINEIAQNKDTRDTVQIDIDFAFEVDEIVELITDDTVEYENYYQLSEWATLISERIDKKANICYPLVQGLFRASEIQVGVNEFKGTLQLTYRVDVVI